MGTYIILQECPHNSKPQRNSSFACSLFCISVIFIQQRCDMLSTAFNNLTRLYIINIKQSNPLDHYLRREESAVPSSAVLETSGLVRRLQEPSACRHFYPWA